jgi:hypothetical protein
MRIFLFPLLAYNEFIHPERKLNYPPSREAVPLLSDGGLKTSCSRGKNGMNR